MLPSNIHAQLTWISVAPCPECIIAFDFEQLCLFVYFVNVFCTSGVYFTNANSLAYCGNLQLLKVNFGPFCNGKKCMFGEILCQGDLLCLFKKVQGIPTSHWNQQDSDSQREAHEALSLALARRREINHRPPYKSSYCKNTQGPRAESRAHCSNHCPNTEREEGEDDPAQGRWEDSGWFRKSWEDLGRVFKQELAFISPSLAKPCRGTDRKGRTGHSFGVNR